MNVLTDFYPLKAQFRPGETVRLRLELRNSEPRRRALTVRVAVTRLLKAVEEKDVWVSLDPLESAALDVELSAQETDFAGFGAQAVLLENDRPAGSGSTAFDVAADWRRSPRYGFLSAFGPGDTSDGDVSFLLKMHLTLAQFYDWVYRHHDFLPPSDEYADLMGKPHSLPVVKRKIAKCHQCGIRAIAYGAVYAAGKEYYESHKSSALYTSAGEPYCFIDVFFIMNLAADSPWRSHIIGEYERSLKELHFDGIHADTYGFPKSGISRAGKAEKEVCLEEELPGFLRETRERLRRADPESCLIFNNVCNWPLDGTAREADAVYVEVWEPYERYTHIQQIIAEAKRAGGGRPVVLAAYLAPFREEGRQAEAENAALLLTAAIAANGAYHLLLGGENGVLTQGYYPDHSILRTSFLPVIRRYYDFIVCYEEILFDDALCDVSMTHSAGDNGEYRFENGAFSPYARPGAVWTVIRESRERKVVSFINLTGNGEDFWNRGKQTPVPQRDIRIFAEILRQPKNVWFASPDSGCAPQKLPYRIGTGKRGKVLEACLPEVRCWSVVVMDF